METLQFILIGLLIVSVIYLVLRDQGKTNAINKLIDGKVNPEQIGAVLDIVEGNVKKINERLDQLFNTIDTQVQDNQSFKNEIAKIVERKSDATNNFVKLEMENLKSYVNDFPIVWERNIKQSNNQLNNYAIANDLELAKIMEKVNSIEDEQVELSHSFDTMLTSLADVKTAEFLDNLGYSHETE